MDPRREGGYDSWFRYLVLRRRGTGAYLANNHDSVVLTTPTRLILDFEVRNWYFIANGSFEVCGTDGHADSW